MWRVFTYYSLHSNALDAEHLPRKGFINCLRAADVFERGGAGHAKSRATISFCTAMLCPCRDSRYKWE
jgi:hypothetical protein